MRSYIYQCPECQDRTPLPTPPSDGNSFAPDPVYMCECGCNYELSTDNQVDDIRLDHRTRAIINLDQSITELASVMYEFLKIAKREQNG